MSAIDFIRCMIGAGLGFVGCFIPMGVEILLMKVLIPYYGSESFLAEMSPVGTTLSGVALFTWFVFMAFWISPLKPRV